MHRSGAYQKLRKIYEKQDRNPAYLAELAALATLLPDLARKVDSKRGAGDGEPPPWREPLQEAFLKKLYPVKKRSGEPFAKFAARLCAAGASRISARHDQRAGSVTRKLNARRRR